MHLALLLLYGAGLIAAWAQRVRPIAWYLGAVIALDLGRLARAAVLPPATSVREGWELVGRSAEAGLYLASIFALPALAVCVFRPSAIPSTWPILIDEKRHAVSKLRDNNRDIASGPGRKIAAAWLLLWLVVVLSYPELRGDDLMVLYDAVELGGLVVSLGCLWRWWLRGDKPSAATSCTGALIAGSVATVALPWATGQTVREAWGEIVTINVAMAGVVLGLLVRPLLRKARQ